MPAPTPLEIATRALTRLLKEKATYYKELKEGEERLEKAEERLRRGELDPDGNDEYMIRQQKTAIEQTKAVFGPLQARIDGAVLKLKDQIEAEERSGATPAELEAARAALESARADANGATNGAY